MKESIIVKGARVHNLKNLDVEIPKNKLTVITGLSGSGKSSLAFDTLYAEGQRRYVESLSAYARQFLDRLDKPDVDQITGLSPAISIDQKTRSQNPRSTVGTVTEILDYLRLFYSSIGKPFCPKCGVPVEGQSAQEIKQHIVAALTDGDVVMVYAPLIVGKKGQHLDTFSQIKQDGFSRVRVNGKLYRLDDVIDLEKTKKHDIDIVVDRLTLDASDDSRLFESIETALAVTKGHVVVSCDDKAFDEHYSEQFACADCSISFPEINPRLFSFNSPYGACDSCNGLGSSYDFDPELLIEDRELPLELATSKALNLDDTIYGNRLFYEGAEFGIKPGLKVSQLSKRQYQFFLYGSREYTGEFKRNKRGRWMNIPKYWEGVINNLRRRYKQTSSEPMRFFFRQFMSSSACLDCSGERLNNFARHVKVLDYSLSQLCDQPISELVSFFEDLRLDPQDMEISSLLIKEIRSRLQFLNNVGLGYLTLSRRANTLSGGESQRIRLATQIGSGLTGVLYVLDEPSIGLHQRDNDRLLETLKSLRDLGNTLVVVEHDEDTIRSADYVCDIGPFAGRNGGELGFSGTVKQLLKASTLTAQYLRREKEIRVPTKRRTCAKSKWLTLKGASLHNLKSVNFSIPTSSLVVVTGVSGSGKSTLISTIFQGAVSHELYKKRVNKDTYKSITGCDQLEHLITIDQSPIGRTPRSNPVTYVGVFNAIRELFAKTREAKIRGYSPGRFSFNVKGGRCESCQGDGVAKIEMHFLADVYVTCEVCKGHRFNEQTLEVTYKGQSIYDVLEMTVNQAYELFEAIPVIARKLQTLIDVGLGYVKCGQSATTLSGGKLNVLNWLRN